MTHVVGRYRFVFLLALLGLTTYAYWGNALTSSRVFVIPQRESVIVWCENGEGGLGTNIIFGSVETHCIADTAPDPPFSPNISPDDIMLSDGESFSATCHGSVMVSQNSYYDKDYGFYSFTGELIVSCRGSGQDNYLPFVTNGADGGYP